MHVRLSDQKIKAISDLIDSIPLPQKSSMSVPSTKVSGIQKTLTSKKKYDYVFLDLPSEYSGLPQAMVESLSLSCWFQYKYWQSWPCQTMWGRHCGTLIISKKYEHTKLYKLKNPLLVILSFLSLQVPAIPTIPAVGKELLSTPQLLAEIVSGKKLQMCLFKGSRP